MRLPPEKVKAYLLCSQIQVAEYASHHVSPKNRQNCPVGRFAELEGVKLWEQNIQRSRVGDC
jgi:hypothetical protein